MLRLPKNRQIAERLIAHHTALFLRLVKIKQSFTTLKTIHYRHIDIQYNYIEVVVVVAINDLQSLKTILCSFYIKSSWKLLRIALQKEVFIVYQQHFWLFGLRHYQGLKISTSLDDRSYLRKSIYKLSDTFVFKVRTLHGILVDFILKFCFAHSFEIYSKCWPFIYFTFNFNRTTHLLNNHFANWQTKTSTLWILLPMLFQIVKIDK